MLSARALGAIRASTGFGAFAVIAYALAQHVGWIDAIALVLAFGQVLRALSLRLASEVGGK